MTEPATPVSAPITPEQMRAARARLGWSLDRLAAQSGTTRYFVTRYERTGRAALDRRDPEINRLAAIRVALQKAETEYKQATTSEPLAARLEVIAKGDQRSRDRAGYASTRTAQAGLVTAGLMVLSAAALFWAVRQRRARC